MLGLDAFKEEKSATAGARPQPATDEVAWRNSCRNQLCLSLKTAELAFLLSGKFYNWPFTSVIIFLIGMFFKRNHWPLAGTILTVGIGILCITSLVNAVRFHFLLRKNPFLRWFGSISCIIITVYMFSWLVMMQHWSAKVGNTLGYIGIVLFVLSVLGMVFTLPGSDYLNWSMIERKIFYRSVIVPMVIVFSLIIISLVFSEAFLWLMNRSGPPLGLKDSIELLNLEGISK